MIKISDKIWYVLKPEHKDELAYMCPYSENKDGTPLANVAKMQDTGRSWAGGRIVEYKKDEQGHIERDANNQYVTTRDEYVKGKEFTAENTPTKGFYVGSSVSRWSTSNKLFRVKDPRGFTVEIPTDNLATLLHHTTVVKGVVQEECVWGREGNNHILLPINSEPYLITLDQMDTLENKLISLKDLKVGDVVKMFEDKSEYYYAGKIKGSWTLRGYSYGGYWDRDKGTKYSEWTDPIKDDKWVDAFLRKNEYSEKTSWSVETFSKPKIVEIVKHEPMEISVEEYSWYCPQRVTNKTNFHDRWQRTENKLVSVEYKK